ncbi:MAG: site-specific integrase [Lachnospiraceae bacterium]|nr:site-specific integrase [Lachnospiraceae bacterium]
MATKRTDSKKRNLRTGEGQREDGRYYYRYTNLSGKRKMVYALTLADLREKEKQITRDLEDGIDSTGAEVTLNELFDLYLQTKTKLKESTVQSYSYMYNLYVRSSTLGEMKISDIKAVHVLNFYSLLTGSGFSKNTLLKIHNNLIAPSFQLGVKSDFIRKNPAEGAGKEISGPKKKVQALSRQQQAALLKFVSENAFYQVREPMLTVFLQTGLRQSELSGLRWKDVDFKAGILHIRQQLVYHDYGDGYRFHLQTLKTEASRRDIPITKECKRALMKQREYDMMLNIKRQEVEGITDYIFITREGKPLCNSGINSFLESVVNKYNLEEETNARKERRDPLPLPHISCHVLRHCYGTRMAESGVPAKTLQTLLGHSDIKTTLNIYVNLDFEEIKKQVADAETYMNAI